MTEDQLRKIIENPFASNALTVLDEAEKTIVLDLKEVSIENVASDNLEDETATDILFLADKSLKVYSNYFSVISKDTLQKFEIQLGKDI